ncbi:receptor kinase-like protein Xa21 [Solanum stenotomum]|uniref:receptor kinase-like protein Xa21 n=1 Tax=Solanum stenotomum TaxID=172797 RepID=UPI0020D1CD3A|nr:receptor kinase-like protein Xa21 [Solanum stenotomum]
MSPGSRKNLKDFKARPAQSSGSLAQGSSSFSTGARCGRTHPGKCRDGQKGCFKCGQEGHFMKECPKNKQSGGNLGSRTQSSSVAPPDRTTPRGAISSTGGGEKSIQILKLHTELAMMKMDVENLNPRKYGSEGIVSASGDVYSYGIMLMEVLTKRRPTDEEICNENLDLRKWITQSFSGTMMDIVDANLFSKEEQITYKSKSCIASMMELALDCTKETPESRIIMKDSLFVLPVDMYYLYFRVLHFPHFVISDLSSLSKRQRVVALALPNLHLQGTISPSLANLSFLSVLNLENNLFNGGIPYELGHLPRLRVIDIQNNQLQGSIPSSLFQHRRVQVISLAFNKLSGEMWKGPWYVPELRVLDLTNNSLTGIIPPCVGNATKMMIFSLSGNRINGNIPTEIGNLSQLAFLFLTDNQLTGFIPTSLFNISSLLSVSLAFNSLSGPLLLDEGNIVSNLKFLSLSMNQISGCVPSNICQLTELKVLSISYNKITGDIPRNIGCLSKLERFYIEYNRIKGTIPASLGNISTLHNLYCGNNRIVGQIPPELGKLSNLRQLSFGQNYNLIGQIPEAIFNISSLEMIYFNLNNLSGRIPATTGTIPTNLGNLRELRELLLHTNQLTNEPRENELRFFNSLADCRMLQYLEVGFNLLNGVLPNSIGNLSSTIEKFHIVDAHINGLIPTSIGNLSGLTALIFQKNNLTGGIPSDVGKLKQLQGLYLTNNKLQGHIPEENA